MKTFQDSKNRTWRIELNCDNVAAIKETVGVNVLDIAEKDSELLKQLTDYPPMVAEIVFVAIQDQAATAGVDKTEFRRSLNGDAISAAWEGLLAEIVNFSPKSRRSLLAAVLDKQREVEEAATDLALARLNDPALKANLMAALETQIRGDIEKSLESLQRTNVESQMTNVQPPTPAPSAPASSTYVGSVPDWSASTPAATPSGN